MTLGISGYVAILILKTLWAVKHSSMASAAAVCCPCLKRSAQESLAIVAWLRNFCPVRRVSCFVN